MCLLIWYNLVKYTKLSSNNIIVIIYLILVLLFHRFFKNSKKILWFLEVRRYGPSCPYEGLGLIILKLSLITSPGKYNAMIELVSVTIKS